MRFLPHKVGPSRAKHERRGRGSDAGSGGRGLENHAAERGGKPCSHPPASAQKGPRAEGRIVMGTRATRRAAALRARSVRPAGRKPDAGTPKHAERPGDFTPREPIERPSPLTEALLRPEVDACHPTLRKEDRHRLHGWRSYCSGRGGVFTRQALGRHGAQARHAAKKCWSLGVHQQGRGAGFGQAFTLRPEENCPAQLCVRCRIGVVSCTVLASLRDAQIWLVWCDAVTFSLAG